MVAANHHFSRVDTREMKDLIYGRIGHQRAGDYFELLNRFLTLKLSKADFDKSCVETLGRENVPLHNNLLRAIIQNAARANVPPLKAQKVEGLGIKVTNGCPRNSLQSLCGNAFPQSPRKCRSPINRDRKFRDRLSPLGPLGKSPSITCEETPSRIQEESAAEMQSLCSKPPTNEDGEEVEQVAAVPSSQPAWIHVTAPFCVSANKGGVVPKSLHQDFSFHSIAENCQSSHELPDTVSLRGRMQKKLALEGIGVSMESANVLNKGLDMFLKRLLEPCIGMTRSRCTDNRILRRQPNKQTISGFNGQNSEPSYASALDFRIAMESNPSILGEDWPIQLEKISHYTVE